MYVSTNFHGGFKFEQIRLSHEDVSGGNTKLLDLRLRELDLFARSGVSNLGEPVDYVVQYIRVHDGNLLLRLCCCHLINDFQWL